MQGKYQRDAIVADEDPWMETSSPERKATLKAKLVNLAHEYADIKQDHSMFPLGKEHLSAIWDLCSNEDVIITRPDKGAGVVLLDRSDYIAKMMEILGDSNKFECLGSCEEYDNTGLNERALQAFLYRQFKAKRIGESVYERIRPTGSIRPRLYGLPKFINLIPFRSGRYCLWLEVRNMKWHGG